MSIFNNQQTIKDLREAEALKGVMLLFEIPKNLKPKMPPITQIKKDDSNYGIDPDYTKVCVHVWKDNYLLNLPRIIWVRKSWTLRQLHVEFFRLYRWLIYKWYKHALKSEDGLSMFHKIAPPFKHNGKVLDYNTLVELSVEEQFDALFPGLTEENWKDTLSKKEWDMEEMPYLLRVENTSGYSQDCHFCGNYNCKKNCPLPFTQATTVLDMLHKVGVEDNVSFYADKSKNIDTKGKNDFIINLVWHKDFNKDWQRHLSSVVDGPKLTNEDETSSKKQDDIISIDDCFSMFNEEEILDEDNKWYCNKCKEHVQATKKLEIFRAPPILIVSLKRFKQSK